MGCYQPLSLTLGERLLPATTSRSDRRFSSSRIGQDFVRLDFVITLITVVSEIHIVRLAGWISSYSLHRLATVWTIDHSRTGDAYSLKRRHDHHDETVKNAYALDRINLLISRLVAAQITIQITALVTTGIIPT